MTRLALAAVMLLTAACIQQVPSPSHVSSDKVGKPLALALPRHPSGETVDLTQQKGRVVVLDVWATWCEPCVVQLGLYEQLQRAYGERGLQVFAVTVDEDLRQVDRFLSEHALSLPVLVDQDSKASETILGVQQLPTSFLIDRQGVVRSVHEGFDERALAGFAKEIEALLAESP